MASRVYRSIHRSYFETFTAVGGCFKIKVFVPEAGKTASKNTRKQRKAVKRKRWLVDLVRFYFFRHLIQDFSERMTWLVLSEYQVAFGS